MSLLIKVASKPGLIFGSGMNLAGAEFWPGGVRHGGDVSLICGFRTERGKACPDTAACGGERETVEQRNCEALSTDAGRAGGPARSSGEAPVTGVERRGRTIRAGEAVNRLWSGGAG